MGMLGAGIRKEGEGGEFRQWPGTGACGELFLAYRHAKKLSLRNMPNLTTAAPGRPNPVLGLEMPTPNVKCGPAEGSVGPHPMQHWLLERLGEFADKPGLNWREREHS